VERHGDEQLATGGLADIVNHDDVGVIERRSRAGFVHKPPLELAVMAQIRRQEL
jgi:hypothetical protein